MVKVVYDIGELPPLGEVPPRMHAMLVRPDRFGDPSEAIRDEVIDVPLLAPHDVLVATMAAGVNFNNVWAARGVPIDVTKVRIVYEKLYKEAVTFSTEDDERLQPRVGRVD